MHRQGAKLVAEDCSRITISEISQKVARYIKSPHWEWDSQDTSDLIKNLTPTAEAMKLKERNKVRGLEWLFSQGKPEWIDWNDWKEMTTVEEGFNLQNKSGKRIGSLGISVSPLNKDRVTFTHPFIQSVWDSTEEQYVTKWVEMKYEVRLTRNQFEKGGYQYYFICPLSSDVPCQRKVSVLYLPPGAKYFGCRHCYNLSYASRNASGGTYYPSSVLYLYEKWLKNPDDSKTIVRLYDAVVKEEDTK